MTDDEDDGFSSDNELRQTGGGYGGYIGIAMLVLVTIYGLGFLALMMMESL